MSKKNIGYALEAIFILVPVVIWLLARPFGERFVTTGSSLRSLGQVLGLAGMSLFALNLIIASRAKWLDRLFGGLNNVYPNHHRTGSIAFVMLLFHPLALALNYITVSAVSTANFLMPNTSSIDTLFGWLSLGGMTILITLTFYFSIGYHRWKISHKFFGLVFAIAIIHTLLVSSDITTFAPLRIFIYTISLIALWAVFYRTIFHGLANKHSYRVVSTRKLGNSMEIILSPIDQKLMHQAGQFVFVKFISDRVSGETHPFSIASAPESPELSLVIKNLGDHTSTLDKLKTGDRAIVEGAFGQFCREYHSLKQQIWVAGGVGIVPFLSMMRALPEDNQTPIHLFYCVKNSQDFMYVEDLKSAADRVPNFSFFQFDSSDKGLITAEFILKTVGNLDGDILICGPTPMMQSLRTQLRSKGVDDRNIVTEDFEL